MTTTDLLPGGTIITPDTNVTDIGNTLAENNVLRSFNFDNGDGGLEHGVLNGGTIDFSQGFVRGTYPAGVDGNSVWTNIPLGEFNTREIFVEFKARFPTPVRHGLKFLKVFGKNNQPGGYANTTFGLDYSVAGGSITAVSFGGGSVPENDTANVIKLNGDNPDWIGRSYGGALVNIPQYSNFTEWGTDWHRFRIHCKFNSGDSAENEVADGAYYLEIDGKVYVDAVGLFNRHWSNGDIGSVQIFGWSQTNVPNFTVDYDDLVVSRHGFVGR